MMLLLLLIATCSADVISRGTWGARTATDPITSLKSISDIIIGSAGDGDCSGSNCYSVMRTIQSRDQNDNKLPDTNFNFYISASGTLLEGRGWKQQGSFTTRFADTSLGIGYLGNYNQGISSAAENAIKVLLRDGFSSATISLNEQYCLLFTCDQAIKDENPLDDICPGGNTYNSISNFYVTYQSRNLAPKHSNRPCGCGRVEDPANGKAIYSTYNTDAVATYQCNRGYVLIGDTERKCQVSGSWSDVGELPTCEDPKKSLVIIPKKTWDIIADNKNFIKGFPISTFFISAVDKTCDSDKDCRSKLKEIKRDIKVTDNEDDVPCNFYVARNGVLYEGRGWGVKGAYIYSTQVDTMQGICFLGYDAVTKNVAVDALFKLVKEAQDTLKIPFNYCFKSDCPNFDESFCNEFTRKVQLRSNGPGDLNKYCQPPVVKPDLRATAKNCRLRTSLNKEWLNYEGQKASSKSGCKCQHWEVQQPIQHSFYPAVYPHAKLTKNYCRNPDLDEKGPWCITDPATCQGYEAETCEIPQCAPSISFQSNTRVTYTLAQPRPTVRDKLSLSFKPNNGNTRILRIEGQGGTYWDVRLLNGYVKVVIVLKHGVNLTTVRINSTIPLTMRQQSSIHILRKNNKFLTMINNDELRYTLPVNLTTAPTLEFVRPDAFFMGSANLPNNLNAFTGCFAEATFNQHKIISVLAGTTLPQGTLDKYPSVMTDNGCAAVLPFEWGNIDIETPGPTSEPNVTDAKPDPDNDGTAEPVQDDKDKSWPYIIVGLVLLVLVIVFLIICVFFKRYNRDKGVYKVDEAKTTKWDWKKGIMPVKSKPNHEMDYATVNKDDNPEVFA